MAATFKVSTDGGGTYAPVNTSVTCDLGNSIVCKYDGVAATTYTWQVVFAPKSPNGTSSAVSLAPQGPGPVDVFSFSAPIDNEGAYLVRLTVDEGLPSEDTQYLRVRANTSFGGHRLVAAGERYDDTGHIPFDIGTTGWTDTENEILHRLNALVRRASSSGRVLYVDANRGRDKTNDPNDPTVVVDLPGWDKTDPGTEIRTGVVIPATCHGDFYTIQSAIDWATGQVPPPSEDNPWVVFIQPGYYVENLALQPHVHLVGNVPWKPSFTDVSLSTGLPGFPVLDAHAVFLEAPSTNPGHTVVGGGTSLTSVSNVTFFNNQVTSNPLCEIPAASVVFNNCVLIQAADDPTQGPVIYIHGAGPFSVDFVGCSIWQYATNDDNGAVILDSSGRMICSLQDTSILSANNGIIANPSGHEVATCRTTLNGCYVRADGIGVINTYRNFVLSACNVIGRFEAVPGNPVAIMAYAPGPGFDSDVGLDLRKSHIEGNLILDTTNLDAGRIMVSADACCYDRVVYPDPLNFAKVSWYGRTKGMTLEYDPDYRNPWNPGTSVVDPANQLSATTVQAAIDELANRGSGGGGGITYYFYNDAGGVNVISDLVGHDHIAGVSYTGVNPSSSLALPNSASRTDGDRITVKDIAGNATTKPIIISPTGGGTIDGGPSYTISGDYGAVTLFFASSNWFVV